MSKQNVAHVAFNRGEVCKEGLGRIDQEKMALAAACQVNWMPWAIGPMMLRPGLEYIGGVRNDAAGKLLKFVYSKTDTALLELTDNVMRVRINDELVTRAAVDTEIASGDFATPPSTFTISPDTDSASFAWAGKTLRQVIKGSDVPAGDTLVLELSCVSGSAVAKVYVGKKAGTQGFASTPVLVRTSARPVDSPDDTWRFNSSPSNGFTQQSHPISYVHDGVSDIVVAAYFSFGSPTADKTTQSGWQAYQKAGAFATQTTATGFSAHSHAVALVTAVTVYPTSSADWDLSGTSSGCSSNVSGGVMTLNAAALGGIAQAKQTIAIDPADVDVEHALRVTVTEGPVTLRIGSADGLDDYLPQTDLDTGTHSLAFTPLLENAYLQIESTDPWPKNVTGVQIEAAGVLEVPTAWSGSDLYSLRTDQSFDIVYVACDGRPQYKIERRSPTSWSVVLYKSVDGPFYPVAGRANTNIKPSGTMGEVTLTADKPYFEAGDVGSLFRLFNPGQTLGQTLGAQDTWTPAVRVQGVGAQRNFNVVLNGTYTGTITVQQSFDGPDTGWVDVQPATIGQKVGAGTPLVNFTLAQNTGGTRLDNVIVWYRVGFKSGNYTSGSVTVTSSFAGGGGYGIARITSVLSSTVATASVIRALSSAAATADWVQQQWNGVDGYPSAVGFHDGRLGWFGHGFWCSESDGFTSFATIDSEGASLGEAGAINKEFGSGPAAIVPWSLSLQRLLVGREMSIGSAKSSALDSPITPDDITIKDCATHGAARLPAVKIGAEGIYVDGGGTDIMLLSWQAQRFDYYPRKLTRLNLDIGKPGFRTLDVQLRPETFVRLPRNDGQEAVLLYEPNEDTECFWRAQTLGVIEDTCVLPSAIGTEDLVYVIVRRLIDGQTKRFIERYAPRANCVGGLINQLLDSHLVYDGSATATVTAAHLPNTEALIWADGAARGSATSNGSGVFTMPGGATYSKIVVGLGGAVETATGEDISSINVGADYEGMPAVVFADGVPVPGSIAVSGGAIALPNNRTADTIVACLGFVAPFMSAKLAYGAQLGTALNQKKKIDHIGLVAYDTHYQGVQYGQRFDNLHDLPLYADGVPIAADKVFEELDKPSVPLAGEWSTDSRLCLLAQAPYPAKLGGAVISLEAAEKAVG